MKCAPVFQVVWKFHKSWKLKASQYDQSKAQAAKEFLKLPGSQKASRVSRCKSSRVSTHSTREPIDSAKNISTTIFIGNFKIILIFWQFDNFITSYFSVHNVTSLFNGKIYFDLFINTLYYIIIYICYIFF